MLFLEQTCPTFYQCEVYVLGYFRVERIDRYRKRQIWNIAMAVP
jgi:hypothetical protein